MLLLLRSGVPDTDASCSKSKNANAATSLNSGLATVREPAIRKLVLLSGLKVRLKDGSTTNFSVSMMDALSDDSVFDFRTCSKHSKRLPHTRRSLSLSRLSNMMYPALTADTARYLSDGF